MKGIRRVSINSEGQSGASKKLKSFMPWDVRSGLDPILDRLLGKSSVCEDRRMQNSSMDSKSLVISISVVLRIVGAIPINTTVGNRTSTESPQATPPPYELDEETYEGDMLDFQPKSLTGSAYKSGLLLKEYLWTDATMYYRFDTKLDIWTRIQLRKAMKNIEKQSCIRFVMYKSEMKDDVDEVYDLQPAPEKWMCLSSVGLICKDASLNCTHRMLIGEDCPLGSLVHELMHALGFVHEQSRPDRDDFIVVHYDNMKSRFHPNFAKYKYPLRQTTPYDYESIMHYDAYAFTDEAKRLPTIQNKQPLAPGVEMGQRWKLSKYDIMKLNELYNCTTKEPSKTRRMLTKIMIEGGAKLEQ